MYGYKMLIYIVTLFAVCLFDFLFLLWRKKFIYRKLFLFFSFMTMTLVLGLRGSSVGEDTRMYLSMAKLTDGMTWRAVFSGFPKSISFVYNYENGSHYNGKTETLYLALNKLIMSVIHDAQWVLFIVAVLTCIGFAKFIYDNCRDHIFFGTYVFLCESLFMNSFNAMRQSLSISIAINAYTCIKNRKYLKGLLLILFASCFHVTSIVYLVLFPICWLSRNEKSLKYVMIGALAFVPMISVVRMILQTVSPYYAEYLQVSYWKADVNGTFFLWGFELIVVICFFLKKDMEQDDFMAVACTAIYLSVEVAGLQFTALSRLAMDFSAFLILLFPRFMRYQKGVQELFYVLAVGALLTGLYFSYARSPTRNYTFFWGSQNSLG